MEFSELTAQPDQRSEQLDIINTGNAGEVGAQELIVSLTVGRRVKNGVDVMEYVFRPESLVEVAFPIGDESQSEAAFKILGELGS